MRTVVAPRKEPTFCEMPWRCIESSQRAKPCAPPNAATKRAAALSGTPQSRAPAGVAGGGPPPPAVAENPGIPPPVAPPPAGDHDVVRRLGSGRSDGCRGRAAGGEKRE